MLLYLHIQASVRVVIVRGFQPLLGNIEKTSETCSGK